MMLVTSITFLFLTYHHIELFNNVMQRLVEIYRMMGIDVKFSAIDITFSTYILVYIILMVTFVLTSFLWYYVTHLCIKFMGGKHGYDQTYKAMTYSLSADYLTLPAFIVSFISLTITLVNRNIIATIIFFISTILYLIPTFYRLYLRLVGLEKLQEISKFNAFIATYIFAYVLLFFVVIIIDIIIIFIFFLLMTFFGFDLPF